MKTTITSALFLLGFASTVLGQADTTKKADCKNDSTKMEFGSYDVIVIKNCKKAPEPDTANASSDNKGEEDKPKKSSYSTWPGSTNIGDANRFLQLDYSKSISWGINFADIKFKIVPNYVNLTTGLGFQWNKYGLKNNYTLHYNEDSIYGVKDTLVTFSKNKLNATYFQIPLLLEFHTNAKPRKAFHFAFGVIGGYKLGSNYKQEYSAEGFDAHGKTKGHYQLNPFQLYGTVRIGYGKRFTAFANYGLTPVFESGKGPDLRPFTVGLYLPL
jgi:hypothetical protein